MRITAEENGLFLVWEVTQEGRIRFLHMGNEPLNEGNLADDREIYTIAEIQVTGQSRREHYGLGHAGTLPGSEMEYIGHRDERNGEGRRLVIESRDCVTGLHCESVYQFFDGIPVVRCRNRLTNRGARPVGLEVVSSYVQCGIGEAEEEISVLIPHNGWQEELQWKELSLDACGYHIMADCGSSSKRVHISSTGSWSTGEYLPMGVLRNRTKGTMQFWQIEHNGSWSWEIQERRGKLALAAGGPDEVNHHWWKSLKPGDTFDTVAVCAGCVKGDVDQVFSALTRYRRRIRRENEDNRRLPVIFNDYMNCLWADPTTEKEFPLIEAAARIGCEYYCIDAGWYTDGNWWYEVGEWKPSETRFPGGLREVTEKIRKEGMVPGIWLEIEVMGSCFPFGAGTDSTWLFQRHGEPLIDRDRFQLDFRNPQVRRYTRGVIDRMIREYGIGYFKIDYNINAGIGTDYQADSPGDGLLEHNRAYLSWLDEIFADYPEVVIENCSSGGMRMDYAMLSRCSIQSTSDQTSYLRYASIAANAPTAAAPEQAAIWSYPMSHSDREETVFNCVNSCLLRIHQSGHMGTLAEEKKAIVKEELEYYKSIRQDIPRALPFWPLGLARDGDGWMSLGLGTERKIYLAVWRLEGEDTCSLPISGATGKNARWKVAFPAGDHVCSFAWQEEEGVLKVKMQQKNMARIFEAEW